jgi:cyclic beta-1,2-glucan synthetase
MSTLFAKKAWRDNNTWNQTDAISAEIFGTERFRQHAHSLADSQGVTETPLKVFSIIDRLDLNATFLREAYRDLSLATSEGKSVTPAAEWLIDNYHVVEQHVRQTRADLPRGFYRQLPKLANGPLAGHPRIFGLVWAYVAHTDSRFDPDSLTDFVNAYQDVQPLTIGELWAVAISLRLILIENMRRVSQRIVEARQGRDAANVFADYLLKVDDLNQNMASIFGEIGEPTVTQQFAVQLIQRLREQTPLASIALEWLKLKTEQLGYSFENAVSEEHLRQGAANVTIRNIVTSLRLISDINWESWFDSVSLVDKLMRSHANYGAMDFPSRTLYRTAIEELARGSNANELDIARRVLAMNGQDPGFHLIGAGRPEFEKSIAFRPPIMRLLKDKIRKASLAGYIGGILLSTAIALLVALWPFVARDGLSAIVVAIALLSLFPALDFGVSVMNLIIAKSLHPAVLPGFALREGVPRDLRTLVVIPSLLISSDEIEDLVEHLEVHFLSNADGELYFALVTDWMDAEVEVQPSDEVLLQQVKDAIVRLNQRHETDRFVLLHRSRRWNSQQEIWMGWERKRGKLHELNRLLRGATDTSFTTVSDNLPHAIRFVITLDADTRLPRDAARRLVGKLAHPLNSPKFDKVLGRVTEGYAILQPRVTPSLPVRRLGSRFQRIYSAIRGIDPYAFAVSDAYQDLFGEGSFAGKGIYEIDAFEASLIGKVSDNTMLSHDLFEGTFARAGLVTDIEVVEEYPERYAVAAARQHRWTRGDWQLLPWMFRFKRINLPALGLWKMIDNLRRSLTPVAIVLGFALIWASASLRETLFWTIFIILSALVPMLLPSFSIVLSGGQQATLLNRFNTALEDVSRTLAIVTSNIMFLGHHAGLMLDAIIRTIYRLTVSRKNLLEWTTAAQANAGHRDGISNSYSLMASSVVAAFVALFFGLIRADGLWLATTPFAIVWFLAPVAATWMSKSALLEDALAASPSDRKYLRRVARRTWRFFETFTTAAENMLPPDNFQETPNEILAHRTSPTNIGLYLLSIASAREFGWIGLSDCIRKIEATLATVRRLEKFRGHLYNWYDTADLRPLDPKYISTVDSGNLAGHLIALSNYCEKWNDEPPNPLDSLEGIEDILDILEEDMLAIPDDRRGLRPLRKQFDKQLAALRKSILRSTQEPETVSMKLIDFAVQATHLQATILAFSREHSTPLSIQLVSWADTLRGTIESHFKDTGLFNETTRRQLQALAVQTREYAMAMEFGFLFNTQRQLLSIGYRISDSALDESCYDMLASEARLASYFAIAKGDLRTRHWFKLGRSTTAVKGGAVLMSWSGSMFEYLMPSLVMRAPTGGLLDQTTRLVVDRQIEYARLLGIPWGISESAFNARDIEFTYQYSNFGVPGLGLKRGLADNFVVAPYATGLAAMIAPRLAARNFELLKKEGGLGFYGFYEALDYTLSRNRTGQIKSVVRAYFSHHQGMTIVAVLNAVKNGDVRERFHKEPLVKAAELLLQERAPRANPDAYKSAEVATPKAIIEVEQSNSARTYSSLSLNSPVTHVLSNGQYNVILTLAGSGQSTFRGQAITRWREDSVKDDWGSFIYLRDVRTGMIWSAGHMPTGAVADEYQVSFYEEKAEIKRRDGVFTTTIECVVSTEDNAEARRITIANTGLTSRDVELTTYAEIVLAPQESDIAHPAFSKLFVETEYIKESETIVASRRTRSSADQKIWAAQFALVNGAVVGSAEFETDRAKFIGIGNTTRKPAAMIDNGKFSNTAGHSLDSIFALRYRLKIPAGRHVTFTLWTVVADSRETLLDLVDRHRQSAAYDRALMLAWTQGQIQLRHMSISIQEAQLYQNLASHIIYANPALRLPSNVLSQDIGTQASLWPLGISGDRPILLVRIDDVNDVEIVRQLLHAYEYLQAKNVTFDLVILNDRMSSYVQDLQVQIEEMVRKITPQINKGKIYAVRADLMLPETLRVLPAISRVVLYGRRGSLLGQLNVTRLLAPVINRSAAQLITADTKSPILKTSHLEFYNDIGGFDALGREYVVMPTSEVPTPAPWINVVANPSFGFHAAADGGGYTWFENAREGQITSWGNDPVKNPPGEVIYVRDEINGTLYSPTLTPLRSCEGTHLTRHGFGYTVYERRIQDLHMDLTQCVPLADSVKLMRLRLSNQGRVGRKLSLTYYAEWVLGGSRAASAPFVTTMIDESSKAMLARNKWKTSGNEQIAFADMQGLQTAWTGSRLEFLGSYGSLEKPSGLSLNTSLSNTTGAGIDPCCALQCKISLAAGQTVEILLVLGAAPNLPEAQRLIARYRETQFADVLKDVNDYWNETLGAVQVKTPDRSFDIMMNGWLTYQTLACRMWARSGFYQASGAYGFRDQLQDSMALLLCRPEISREHILRAASRQFQQGDVQHWWLPATGMGVRTRISDDTVWLANCANHYAEVTDDFAIFDEVVPFLEGQALVPGEHDVFFFPSQSDETATLYEHCARALDIRLEFGDHGLPLMGTGDWNDGMNRVGEGGKGESVWLGWFLLSTLKDFVAVAVVRDDTARISRWSRCIETLHAALEEHGWDGQWYRRAFYDDGTPMGSSADAECNIDAIAQSWAVLSGGASRKRALQAMDQSYNKLVKASEKLVLLFTPPFDKTDKEPGYIKAYPPGIRENGGQYTHGVIWSIFAHAKLDQAERAMELFNIINPINHARTAADARNYRVEPYVIAADVYSTPPHTGMGGWTWYTGSAGWFYRAGLEAILGLAKKGQKLTLKPCLPAAWNEASVTVKIQKATYDIQMLRGERPASDASSVVKRASTGEFVIDAHHSEGTYHVKLYLDHSSNK